MMNANKNPAIMLCVCFSLCFGTSLAQDSSEGNRLQPVGEWKREFSNLTIGQDGTFTETTGMGNERKGTWSFEQGSSALVMITTSYNGKPIEPELQRTDAYDTREISGSRMVLGTTQRGRYVEIVYARVR